MSSGLLGCGEVGGGRRVGFGATGGGVAGDVFVTPGDGDCDKTDVGDVGEVGWFENVTNLRWRIGDAGVSNGRSGDLENDPDDLGD